MMTSQNRVFCRPGMRRSGGDCRPSIVGSVTCDLVTRPSRGRLTGGDGRLIPAARPSWQSLVWRCASCARWVPGMALRINGHAD
jgi:hypothetical protein